MPLRTCIARRAFACLLLTAAMAGGGVAGDNTASFEPLLPARIDAAQAAGAALGALLFTDPRLSANGERSCASCHHRDTVAQTGDRDPTSLMNVTLNARFGWTGRFDALDAQIDHELLAAERLATKPGAPQALLASDARYRDAVEAWRGREPRTGDVNAALSAYLGTLLTPDSPFDRYLAGQAELSRDALAGLNRFQQLGCSSCHQGRALGGNLLQRIGLFVAYEGEDTGRQLDTGRRADAFVFRVPGLRNVANSAPYFHDGSRRTLTEAIRSMGRMQLARELSADEVAQLEAFLHSLSAPATTLASGGDESGQ